MIKQTQYIFDYANNLEAIRIKGGCVDKNIENERDSSYN